MARPSVDGIDLASETPAAAGHSLLELLALPALAEPAAGAEAAAPILLPVELTLVAERARSFEEAAAMLHHAVSLCNLLANQREQLQHTCERRARANAPLCCARTLTQRRPRAWTPAFAPSHPFRAQLRAPRCADRPHLHGRAAAAAAAAAARAAGGRAGG